VAGGPGDVDAPQVPEDLAARLVAFAGALRSKGVRVGTSEVVDAGQVVTVLGLQDRALLREGLAAALVRRGGQREVFDMTFDLFFPSGVGASAEVLEHEGPLDVEDLRDLLAMALADGDLRTLEQVAELAVDALGQVGTPGTRTAGWSAFQTLDRLAPQTTIARATGMRGQGGAPGSSSGSGSGSDASAGQGDGEGPAFTDRLERDEVRRLVEAFRQMVAADARRRTAEERGRDVVTRHAVRSTSEHVDFLSANRQQLEELRVAVGPLARRLATRLSARRRAASRGRIDVRRTMRKALTTGGVPMTPVHARPHPGRPELVLLCDVSGSVAGFSTFTMLLVRALSDQFSKVRVFAFVNATAEVTDLVKDGGDLAERISREARVTSWHTSSDYGEALGDFAEHHLDAVGPRTSVLVLGDARNNNQPLGLPALAAVVQRARRTFWLNPEHPTRWGLGDSVAPEYAELVEMHPCSTIEQLEAFIGRLLPA
jgi:uncharacterized protein with von Willebrand factor type A (vWA) domain